MELATRPRQQSRSYRWITSSAREAAIMRAFHRTLAITLLACSPLFLPALAQTTVASTFGPGDSYSHIQGYLVGDNGFANQSVAEGFVYTGPDGYFLSQVRLALDPNDSPYTISFLTGADINAATLLESWSTTSSGGIVALSSALSPALSNGMTYWLAASSGGWGGWAYNDQGRFGMAYRLGGGAWVDCPGCESAAYDVTVTGAGVVTPEPATMTLLATGLVGVLGVAWRRRRTVVEG